MASFDVPLNTPLDAPLVARLTIQVVDGLHKRVTMNFGVIKRK